MHRPISWSALADATVGVWGLGVEGQASLRRLRAMGVEPVLVDDAPAGRAGVMATDDGGLDALAGCDVVVKSPGISRYRRDVRRLEEAAVAVCGGLGLFMEEADPARVVCVTGTKGKSTTTAIAVHLLTGLGYRARAGGNIGLPPWDPDAVADGEQPPDYWIIETSSFQIPDLDHGPRVVAVTSLAPDHLDWHDTIEQYYADKLSLCTKPGVVRVVADGSDSELRAQQPRLGPFVEWVTSADVDRDESWATVLGLPGPHNARNASIARAVLVALGIADADDLDQLAEVARGFGGLPSRCHTIGYVGDVEFVDDSLSTNVLPTKAALRAFDDRAVALLVGGYDRGVDYTPLGQAVAERSAPTVVITMPDNGSRIGAAVRRAGPGTFDVVDAESLEDAVDRAFAWARRSGGLILLSPAAPSFGRFADYRARAEAFARAAARHGTLR